MINGTDGQNGIRPPTLTTAVGAVATIGEVRQEIYQRALQRLVGQPLQGQVLSRYTDGSFLVKVADTAARVILPPNTQIGDSLPLTLITVTPRPTFLLGNDNGKLAKSPLIYLDPHGGEEVELSGKSGAELSGKSSSSSSSSAESAEEPALGQRKTTQGDGQNNNLARQFVQIDNLLRPGDRIQTAQTISKGQIALSDPAQSTPEGQTGNQSALASFSTTARLINTVLLSAQQQGAPAALLGKTAIVPEPGAAPQTVAAALQDTLAYSGLFYESHVHEWVDGKRPMTELLREPQMQAANTAESGGRGDAKAQAQAQAQADSVSFPQLVNLQLNTFEHQSTHWRGEIWPGQTMEWDVAREENHTPDNPGEEAKEDTSAWKSTVRFELPSLGTIHASLHLIGDHLHIQVQTDNPDTTNALREHATLLADALGAAGSPLDSLLVQQNAPS